MVGIQVEISHAEVPEKFEIEEEVKKFLEKFGKRWKITRFKLDVDVHSPAGRKKYSMHAKVFASDKIFFANASGWDIPTTLDLLFERLSKRIGKNLKRIKEKSTRGIKV
ncbi:MAG: HPF/RaiA family ribosome-associated protein [Candidatus Aenigmatarchaeota archaeon]